MLLLLASSKASSPNRGQLRVYTSSTANVIKPVKVWNGSSWVIKPVKTWNGTSWVFTFNGGYAITPDSSDSGFYIGNGATESSTDAGFYDIQGGAAKEDTTDAGFFTTS